MPIVRVEMLEGRSAEIKQKLAEEITAVMVRLCSTDPAHVYVIFNEVPRGDWAVAGKFFPESAANLAKPQKNLTEGPQ
jgi:4-oxalocrotonate tautomerase